MNLTDIILQEFEQVNSTQDVAIEKLNDGSLHIPFAISAKSQSKGRGRYENRTWDSPNGNIAVTICLNVAADKDPTQLCYVAANAICQTLSTYAPNQNISLKWVNDVLINKKKISGILIQKIKSFALVGIGVNLISSNIIKELGATSLEDLGIEANHSIFLKALLDNFINHYNAWDTYGFSTTRTYWIQKADNLGKEVKINYKDGSSESGIFKDIDEEGKLILDSNGIIKKINGGELFNL